MTEEKFAELLQCKTMEELEDFLDKWEYEDPKLTELLIQRVLHDLLKDTDAVFGTEIDGELPEIQTANPKGKGEGNGEP